MLWRLSAVMCQGTLAQEPALPHDNFLWQKHVHMHASSRHARMSRTCPLTPGCPPPGCSQTPVSNLRSTPPHLDIAALHNIVFVQHHFIWIPALLAAGCAAQVIDHTQGHLGFGAVGVHDGNISHLQAGTQAQMCNASYVQPLRQPVGAAPCKQGCMHSVATSSGTMPIQPISGLPQ